MVQRFYIDTSVIGGVFDTEFEEHSSILMEKVKLGRLKAVISDVTESEIMKARKEIRDFYSSLPKSSIEFVDITKDAVLLADNYIKEKVVAANCLQFKNKYLRKYLSSGLRTNIYEIKNIEDN